MITGASTDNTVTLLQQAVTSTGRLITYPNFDSLPFTETLPIYALSTNITIVDDGCNALPASTPDLTNYITIVRRGTCTFVSLFYMCSSILAKEYSGS